MDRLQSEIIDIVKTPAQKYIDEQKIKGKFVYVGRSMLDGSAGGYEDEERQRVRSVFSDDNMQNLCRDVMQNSVDQWEKHIRHELRKICGIYEVSDETASYYIDKYIKLFFGSITETDSNKYEVMALGSLLDGQSLLENNGVKIIDQIEGVRTQLIEIKALMLDKSPLSDDLQSQNLHDDKVVEPLGIPVNDGDTKWELSYCRTEDITQIIQIWKQERELYPGWFIPQYRILEDLARKTDFHLIESEIGKMSDELLLSYAFEYCWRWNMSMGMITEYEEKTLRTLFFHLAEVYLESIEDIQSIKNLCSIGICLARDAIEEADNNRYRSIINKLNDLITRIPDNENEEVEKRIRFVEIQWDYASRNLGELSKKLQRFNVSLQPDDIALSSIGMLYELGEWERASDEIERLETRVEESISTISDVQNDESKNIHQQSILAAVYQLHRLMMFAADPFSNDKSTVKEYRKKTDDLKSYYSLVDIEAFAIHDIMTNIYNVHKQNDVNFNPRRETRHLIIGGSLNTPGYTIYRAIEKSGIPLHARSVTWLDSSQEYYMLKDIAEHSPRMGVVLSIRCSRDIDKRLYSYSFLAENDISIIEFTADFVSTAVSHCINDFKHHLSLYTRDAYTVLLDTAREILLRVDASCRTSAQREIFRLFVQLYKDGCLGTSNDIATDFEYLSLFTPIDIKKDFLDCLIGIEANAHCDWNDEKTANIIQLLGRTIDEVRILSETVIDSSSIDKLIDSDELFPSGHIHRMEMLIELCNLEMLDDSQKKAFAQLLWKNRDEITGLPKLPNRYKAAYIRLPEPEDTDVRRLVKNYFLDTDWVSTISSRSGAYFFGSRIRFFDELKLYLEYSKELGTEPFSIDETQQLLQEMHRYYELEGDKIVSARDPEIRAEYEGRFLQLIMLMGKLLDGRDIEYDLKQKLLDMICRLEIAGVKIGAVKLYLSDDAASEIDTEKLLEGFDDEKTVVYTGIELNRIVCSHAFSDEKIRDILLRMMPYFYIGTRGVRKQIAIIIHNLLYLDKDILTPQIRDSIERGLKKSRLYDIYSESKGDEDIKETMLVRESMARLAGSMIRYIKLHNLKPSLESEEWIDGLGGERFNLVSSVL